MPILSPAQAARIALRVYALRSDPFSEVVEEGGLGTEGLFAADSSSTFQATSGAVIRRLSTFGYIAAGTGPFAGEALIATRGTDIVPDWLTNLNIGVETGPGGLTVHSGFHRTWKSFSGVLEVFLAQHRPRRVHCVGHSLGGALATLSADYLSARRVATELYTFGSPRVGGSDFAASLTRRLGAASIRRVVHPLDPVPMIPLYPFFHAPYGEPGLLIARGKGGLISAGAHSIPWSYAPGVQHHTWETLANASGQDSDLHVKSWLERAADGHGSFAMGSASLLTMIGRALGWILAKAGKLVLNGVGFAATAGVTALDLIVGLLSRAVDVSKTLAGHVKTLIVAILHFLGRAAATTVDLTVSFLRWVLGMMFGALASAAQRALALLD